MKNRLESCFYFSPKHLLTFIDGLSGELQFKPFSHLLVASEEPFEVCYDGKLSEHNCFILEDNRAMNILLKGGQFGTLTLDKSEMDAMISRREIERRNGYAVVHDGTVSDTLLGIRQQQQDMNMASWNVMQLIYDGGPILLSEADKRLVKAVAWMYLNASQNVSMRNVAEQIHLSESRLANLFKDKLGVTFNRVKLSLRLLFFIERYAESNDLTASCLDAGFHDLSHFYKTYRLAFGMAPSLIFDNEQPPEIVYNPGFGMSQYGEWLGNAFHQLICEKDEASVMDLFATFLN